MLSPLMVMDIIDSAILMPYPSNNIGVGMIPVLIGCHMDYHTPHRSLSYILPQMKHQ